MSARPTKRRGPFLWLVSCSWQFWAALALVLYLWSLCAIVRFFPTEGSAPYFASEEISVDD